MEMTQMTQMTQVTTARIAGLFWLLFTIAIGFSLTQLRMPMDLIGRGADAEVVSTMLRTGIALTVVAHVMLLCFGLTLFHLFRDVGGMVRIVMLTSCAISTALGIANTLNYCEVLALMTIDPALTANVADFGRTVTVASKTANFGQALLEIFWSAMFFCFGLLVVRSGYLPRIFGSLLFAMSAGYPVNSLTKILLPQFYAAEITQATILLAAVGGLPTMAWLLIKGASTSPRSPSPTTYT
ncbi:MAG: DUF4386 domain-containing protein [Parasphingopyxis sp.]|nr:DUF4386 domain-containing protein [Sphingomonadales bacterium]